VGHRRYGASAGVPAGQGAVEGGRLPTSPRKREEAENSPTAGRPIPRRSAFSPACRASYAARFSRCDADYVAILEYTHVPHIYGRRPIKARSPTAHGRSRARWEGSTLVVDVIHFTDQTWLDRPAIFTATRCVVELPYATTAITSA
jgi:hypothetical protein